MFEFRLYLYDLNFNDLNESIDLFPALLNEDISLTIERERGVFEKTNSDLSLNFSNLVKLSNGQTILKYLKNNIASKKFRIKVLSNNKIIFDGYVENESISYDVENETLSLNVFAIEKEFWKRCENILFSEVNPYTSNGETERSEIFGTIFNLIKSNINTKQYFKDIFNDLILNTEPIIKNKQIVVRNNTLKTGMYWLDRDKMSLKEFFEAIIKIYNLEFKIDYDLKEGIFKERLVVNNSTATDISKDVIKSGITFTPEIEKFNLIKVNDIADINNSELFIQTGGTFAIDTGNFHGGTSTSLTNWINPTESFWETFRASQPASEGETLYWDVEGIINWGDRVLKAYMLIYPQDEEPYISTNPFIERTVPDANDDNQFPKVIIPVISDIDVIFRRILITGATIGVKWHEIISWKRVDIYPLYDLYIFNNNNPYLLDAAQNSDGSYRFNVHYFLTDNERNNAIFNGTREIQSSVYRSINSNIITDETQIKRSNIFELENEIKLKFHEDKNNDGTLNTNEDKPKEATRNQIQKMFGLGGKFYQDLINNFKSILKSTSKIECEVNRDDLRVGDKIKINLTSDIDGEYVINKNEIDLINGISKIEALSEVI